MFVHLYVSSWIRGQTMSYTYHVCPPVREIIHSLKLVDYLHEQAYKPWYHYYMYNDIFNCLSIKIKYR